MKRFLKDCLGAALLAGVLCYATTNARAAQPAMTDAEMLTGWEHLNDMCRGNPDDATICNARDTVTKRLKAHGWAQGNHDVWVSVEECGAFVGVISSTEEWAQDKSDLVKALAAPAAMKTLRRHMPDEVIAALWAQTHETIRDQYPRAWAMLSDQMRALRFLHPNDPRYSLEQ